MFGYCGVSLIQVCNVWSHAIVWQKENPLFLCSLVFSLVVPRYQVRIGREFDFLMIFFESLKAVEGIPLRCRSFEQGIFFSFLNMKVRIHSSRRFGKYCLLINEANIFGRIELFLF